MRMSDEEHAALGLPAAAARIAALAADLGRAAAARAAAERAWGAARSAARQRHAAEHERLEAERAAEHPEDDPEAAAAAERAHGDRALARVAEAAARVRRRLRAELDRRLAAAGERAGGGAALPDAPERARRRDACQRRGEELRRLLDELGAEFVRTCRQARLRPPPAPPAGAARPLAGAPEEHLEACAAAVAGAREALDHLRRSAAFASGKPVGILLTHAAVALPHLIVLPLLPALMLDGWWPAVLASLAATQGVTALCTRQARRSLRARLASLGQQVQPLGERLARAAEHARQELDPQGPMRLRLERALGHEADAAALAERLNDEHARAAARVRAREQRLRDRATARAAAAAERARDAARERARARAREQEEAGRRLEAATAAALAAADRAWAEAGAAQQAAWDRAIAEAGEWAAGARARCAGRHPAWAAAAGAEAAGDPAELPLGTARLDLARLAAEALEGAPPLALAEGAALELPLALALPGCASLLVRHHPAGRAEALALANQLALRALAAFPPGHLRLVLLDPAGLGDAFTPLLDLADHDEALLGGGVHSGAERIERALDDLAAHLSTVIQKHLRGRYDDLDAYNREAGEMREAVRLVVVAGFPDGFGERALERLATLAATGARCGVHLAVVADARRPLPAFLEPAAIRQGWVQVAVREDGCHLVHPGLPAALAPEGLPDPALRGRLLAAVGRAAGAGRRIQVPFAAVAPPDDGVWSASTAEVLSVPVGRRGADRIQRFELGRGTCQHALVGGRTGSGKSTLFHVLVTNAALWHHPDQLEVHLIDFKKGVEFRTYAVNRLPHARVIAIESDREFGLSVLRHLDGELVRRGEAYRRAGAQDVASYRRASGLPLPRILLAIDEFQEFFTEDDAIARDAALLLDRFVRQGRAFGLHVVLGSQTLGGAYSLAKSSLGQMGVRVVLPCNEADAHLLLHEDNDGARLLTRPGDAIYNDRAGLADGNSPFQVCWLGEDDQAARLRALAARAAAEGWRPARPPVVFAGDGPSDLGGMAELDALLAAAPAEADARVRAWVGQSSSIAGPAEVVLPAAAGGNLLLVGLNRESALATLGALAVGLAARHAPGRLRLLLLDGEDADGPGARLWGRLAAALPHGAERVEARGAAALLDGLAAELERRQGGAAGGPVLLCVSALQRLRQLRPDDDLGFGAAGGGAEPPAERFARLIAQGPDHGLHVAVWCDSLTSVQRSLQRRTLKDFDARILFQMGAADSTELADDDGAARLGLHNALNLGLGEGRREKFRPCALPAPELLESLGARLRAKWG